MIITKAPFRISFAGGFADVAAREGDAWLSVVSATVALHCYVTVQARHDTSVVAAYARVEKVTDAAELQNGLFREVLAEMGFAQGLEVHSIGSLSLSSSGLGGSSAAAVAMVQALARLAGSDLSRRTVAERAANVEIKRMGRRIGRQDHFAAAYGGLNVFRFRGDQTRVERMDEHLLAPLAGCCVMVPCPSRTERDASTMLAEQVKADASIPRRLSYLVPSVLEALEAGDVRGLAGLLNEGWELKKKLGPSVTTPEADDAVDAIRKLGGGAKLCGAGGGGHVFGILPGAAETDTFMRARPDAFKIAFDPAGVAVVYDDRERLAFTPCTEVTQR